MAHEPDYIPFLLGIGLRSLSVDPKFLPVVQERIQNLIISDAEAHAKALLSETTIKGIRERMNLHMNSTEYLQA